MSRLVCHSRLRICGEFVFIFLKLANSGRRFYWHSTLNVNILLSLVWRISYFCARVFVAGLRATKRPLPLPRRAALDALIARRWRHRATHRRRDGPFGRCLPVLRSKRVPTPPPALGHARPRTSLGWSEGYGRELRFSESGARRTERNCGRLSARAAAGEEHACHAHAEKCSFVFHRRFHWVVFALERPG